MKDISMEDDGRLTLLEKVVAVHLAECSAAHKAVDLKITQIERSLDQHITQTAVNTAKIMKMLYIGFAILIILTAVGPQEALKILLSFVRL